MVENQRASQTSKASQYPESLVFYKKKQVIPQEQDSCRRSRSCTHVVLSLTNLIEDG